LLNNLCGLGFNNAQELFLVLFSILYGVMLQSLTGLQPFPLGKTLRGYVLRPDASSIEKITAYRKLKDKCKRKEKNELVSMWRWRVFWSIIILNVLPIIYLSGILYLLRDVKIHPELPYPEAFLVGIIFWCALGVFGFYRMYHSLAAWRWEALFCDVELEERRPLSFDVKAHLLWGVCFHLLPGLSFLVLWNLLPYPDVWFRWLLFLWICLNSAISFAFTR